jgi:hypothetical protein
VSGIGVAGHSVEPGSFALLGDSTDGVGVQGGSHGGVGVQGNSEFGVAVQGANVSETDPAVQDGRRTVRPASWGEAPGSTSSSRSPVRPTSVSSEWDRRGGRAVLARSRRGWALQASGRVKFGTAGTAVVASGASQVTVVPAFELVSSAKVLAMPQGDPRTGALVKFVTVDAEANAFTITMTEAVAVATLVAWFVLE